MEARETTVFTVNGSRKYSRDGHFVDMPDGWEFVPSGDPALTRRLKASAPDYWVVKRKIGHREYGVGLCVPPGLAAKIAAELQTERESPEYQRKQESARRQRDRRQRIYQRDFELAVMKFLDFNERWRDLAVKFAKAVTEFTTPVGSGTVARTERIPIEERARAAVIAWMRHNTTDYDHRYIPQVAGRRREVRRDIAKCSIALLEKYRHGCDAPTDCPLQKALAAISDTPKTLPPKPRTAVDEGSFWLLDDDDA